MKKRKTLNKNGSTKMPKLPTYEFGTLIENPATDLYENQIAMARAAMKGKKNPWAKGLKIFGNLAQQVGTSMMSSSGAGSTTPGGEAASTEGFGGAMNSFFGNNQGSFMQGLGLLNGFSQFAMGGEVPNIPVEVEGNEVGETPNGELMEFQGPSHAEGGIPISLPQGTEIFSDRISIDGKTMAERKKDREKKEAKYSKLSEDGDVIAKNTLQRIRTINSKEENSDKKIQSIIAIMSGQAQKNQNLPEHGYGDTVGEDDPILQAIKNSMMLTDNVYGGYGTPKRRNSNNFMPGESGGIPNDDIIPFFNFGDDYGDPDGNQYKFNTEIDTTENPTTTKKENKGFKLGGDKFTLGDMMGIAGNLYQAFAPMNNTLENRAGDTPNINAFKDYGKDALNRMDESKGYIEGQKDEALGDLQLTRTTSVKRNRNSARGVNTMRALDLAVDANINDAQGNIYDAFSKNMMSILGQEAQLENDQDAKVMQGEYMRDLADRQDRDNFYTQLGQDKMTMGEGISRTGKSLNDAKQRTVTENFMNEMFGYVQGDVFSGNITGKKQNNESMNFKTQYPDLTAKEVEEGKYTEITNPMTGKPFSSEYEYDWFKKFYGMMGVDIKVDNKKKK